MASGRGFETSYRVRFDEAGGDGLLRSSGLLRYAQDVAWQHSEAAGFGREWYAARDLHWLVRWARLSVTGPIGYGDTLRVATEVIGGGRVWARRLTHVQRVDERPGGRESRVEMATVATVATDWVLLSSAGRPTRVPDEIVSRLSPNARLNPEHVSMGRAGTDSLTAESVVRAADVDPLGHLNNAAYLDLVTEAAAGLGWTGGEGSEARLEYLTPALPRQRILTTCWPAGEGGVACRLQDERGDELCRALLQSRG
ncbi:hypothetical protein BH23CHL8_BH23CHL8_19300 [soil metagenome]